MFTNTFPDLFEMLEYIGEALIMAAENNEEATDIHHRLLSDHMYSINMARVVSFYTLVMKAADFVFSLVHAFPFSGGRSRTVALPSYRQSSWLSRQRQGSCNWPKSNS